MQAQVKYILNGYTVSAAGAPNIPESLYAATIAEVVYWLARLFDPLGVNPELSRIARPARCGDAPAPSIIEPGDPLLGQGAFVAELAAGGFLVTQQASPSAVQVEVYAATMDAVADALTQIFAPPGAP